MQLDVPPSLHLIWQVMTVDVRCPDSAVLLHAATIGADGRAAALDAGSHVHDRLAWQLQDET